VESYLCSPYTPFWLVQEKRFYLLYFTMFFSVTGLASSDRMVVNNYFERILEQVNKYVSWSSVTVCAGMTNGNIEGPSSGLYVLAKIKTGLFHCGCPKLCWSYCFSLTSFVTKLMPSFISSQNFMRHENGWVYERQKRYFLRERWCTVMSGVNYRRVLYNCVKIVPRWQKSLLLRRVV
jgi:hypothetical protein